MGKIIDIIIIDHSTAASKQAKKPQRFRLGLKRMEVEKESGIVSEVHTE